MASLRFAMVHKPKRKRTVAGACDMSQNSCRKKVPFMCIGCYDKKLYVVETFTYSSLPKSTAQQNVAELPFYVRPTI